MSFVKSLTVIILLILGFQAQAKFEKFNGEWLGTQQYYSTWAGIEASDCPAVFLKINITSNKLELRTLFGDSCIEEEPPSWGGLTLRLFAISEDGGIWKKNKRVGVITNNYIQIQEEYISDYDEYSNFRLDLHDENNISFVYEKQIVYSDEVDNERIKSKLARLPEKEAFMSLKGTGTVFSEALPTNSEDNCRAHMSIDLDLQQFSFVVSFSCQNQSYEIKSPVLKRCGVGNSKICYLEKEIGEIGYTYIRISPSFQLEGLNHTYFRFSQIGELDYVIENEAAETYFGDIYSENESIRSDLAH